MTYNFNWDTEFQTDDGEALPPDSLMRAKYAESLSNHIVKKSKGGDYVLNVNAGWGHGKTYFLKRWFIDIKQKHPAVYINAWKHDFSENPLLMTVSELQSQLIEQFSLKKNKLKVDVKALIKAGTPLLVNGVTRKLVGVSFDEIGDEYLSLAGKASEQFAQGMLARHEEQVSAISSFRKELSELAYDISKASKENKLPVFVFIDELDRCRPTFAIELLETVKHLFDVEEFVFVIATDTEQLEHSIKAIYGNGFDAKNYLSRFFSERILLPRSNLERLLLENYDFNFIFDYDEERVFRQSRIEVRSIAKALSELCNDYRLPLRSIFKVLSRAGFAIETLSNRNVAIDPLFLVLLLIIRETNEQSYEVLINDIKPDFNEHSHDITPRKLDKYSVNIIVEPNKLGFFKNAFEEDTLRLEKLSMPFQLRMSELSGNTDFVKRQEELKDLLNRTQKTIPKDDVFNLCILYKPQNASVLNKHDYAELIEHSMLLE